MLSRQAKQRQETLDSGSEAGQRHYAAAMALALELGLRPLVAHCQLGLGKLYARTGKRQQAQDHLTTAVMMYREIRMTYWLEKADQEFLTRLAAASGIKTPTREALARLDRRRTKQNRRIT